MKRTLSLWLGVLALAATPVLAAAQAAPTPTTGKIHGHVIGPEGNPRTNGTVSLSTGPTEDKASFPVNAQGEYSGEAPVGTYTLLYRDPSTPKDKRVDQIDNVKIVAGQDTQQDLDMTRPDFLKTLTPEQQKQLEELKKKNSEALKSNQVVRQLNTDLNKAQQELHEGDTASTEAAQALGASASKADLAAKTAEIKQQKYSDVEQIMQRDSALKPDASILWTRLGQAQLGLKKYDDAQTSLKKAIEVESASKKPNPQWLALSQAALGESYARQGKVAEAQAAYDDAAKSDPTQAAQNYKNESIVFFQAQNTDAQVAAADKAIALAPEDPKMAIAYYIKGNGLVGKTAEDPATHKLVPPPGCMEAYQKYVQLDPNGQFTAEVKQIMASFNQAIPGTYKAEKSKKK
jgi:tetratricopeptide (TPR) repeat protein